MGKRFRHVKFPERVRVIEIYLMAADQSIGIVSKWHEHLEESMSPIERASLQAALDSVAKVVGEFCAREIGEEESGKVQLQASGCGVPDSAG